MSEPQSRRKSDFSIARILADEVNTDAHNPAVFPDDVDVEDVDVVTLDHGPHEDHMDRLRDEVKHGSLSEDERRSFSVQGDLQWLHCTRYRPPRLPRRTSGVRNCKRRPATHPRIPFTSFQLEILEEKYKNGPYLTRKDVVQLAGMLRLPQTRVKIWFQNRRARDRRESKVSSSLSIS